MKREIHNKYALRSHELVRKTKKRGWGKIKGGGDVIRL